MPAVSLLRTVLDRRLTEENMRSHLVAAAGIGGWEHGHVRDSRGQDVEDWPDDWFLRGGEFLWWELKTVRGKPTAGQERLLAALNAFAEAHGLAGYFEARVVRPCDLPACIERLLSRPGLPPAEVL